jgi:hypothetical protein
MKVTGNELVLRTLFTVRDHTTAHLNSGGDEYIPRQFDNAGEKKVTPNGVLLERREYNCRTFLVPYRGDKLFMLATECARILGYRDSYLLFNKNRSLHKIIANEVEKDHLISQDILPHSYRSRQIAIVTARSVFRQFGSRVVKIYILSFNYNKSNITRSRDINKVGLNLLHFSYLLYILSNTRYITLKL